MWLKHISGALTLSLGMAMVFLGLTSQILKNWREGRCGNSLTLPSLATALYFWRAVHASTVGSYYIFIPDVAGILLASISIFQYFGKFMKPPRWLPEWLLPILSRLR